MCAPLVVNVAVRFHARVEMPHEPEVRAKYDWRSLIGTERIGRAFWATAGGMAKMLVPNGTRRIPLANPARTFFWPVFHKETGEPL